MIFPHIYFITGASGVGKTTLVSQLEIKYSTKPDWLFLHFDNIGVPSEADMIKKDGSVENWQRETTRIWIKKMITEHTDKKVIIFEGQVNLNFIKDGFAEHDYSDYTTILVDCEKNTMQDRLANERMQPELVTDKMENWRAMLREQAYTLGVEIIDTNKRSKEESVVAFEQIVRKDGFL